MSETKTFVFPNEGGSGNGMLGMLAPLLQKNGLDPNLLLAMNNRGNGGFGGEGGFFMWIIFLFFLFPLIGRGGWGNGFGGNDGVPANAGLAGLLNNDTGRELLMSAIQGNGQAINNLATNFNCSVGQIQQAINGVMSQVQQVGNQVGQSSMQIINALQQGNCQIAQQLASCCCDMKNLVTTQGYEGQLRTIQQTQEIVQNATSNANVIAAKIDAQTQIINDRFCQLEMREMQTKLDAERARSTALAGQLSQEHQTAQFGQMIGSAVAPANAALADLSARLAKIECKAPETVTIPYSPIVGVPTCVAAQYGIGFNNLSNGGLWG